ncbi:uncharacterized protein SCHCODRAFT_02710728, partial [Schizophyllum commune H4-8]|uniref:uncharacterized protein n=1 Tax=Schizophyllum commune (strain H4-8 / FGSC 9210) TaxID=578458 RepID=UPI00215E41D8
TFTLAAVAPRPLAILEPGKPRSRCGSSAGASFASHFFFLLSIFSPRIWASADYHPPRWKRATHDLKTQEALASSPVACDPDFDVRHRFRPPTFERAEDSESTPTTFTSGIRVRQSLTTSPNPTTSPQARNSVSLRIWPSAEQREVVGMGVLFQLDQQLQSGRGTLTTR